MDTLVAQLAEMKSSLQSLQAAVSAQDASQTMEEDLSTDDPEFCPAQEKWSAILGTSAEEQSKPASLHFASLLSAPPPLEQVRGSGARVKKYKGIPVAPQPRRNRIDQNLWILQQKLDISMHLLIDALETGEPSQIDQAAAEIRSAWEDV